MKNLVLILSILLFAVSCSFNNNKGGIPSSELTDVDSVWMYKGVPYTGTANDVTNGVTTNYTFQNGRCYKMVYTEDGVTYTTELDGHRHPTSFIGKYANGDVACRGNIKGGEIEYCDYFKQGSLVPIKRAYYKNNQLDKDRIYECDEEGNVILPVSECFKIVKESSSWGVYGWSPVVVLKVKNISTRTFEYLTWNCRFIDIEENFEVGTSRRYVNDPWEPGLVKEVVFKPYVEYPSNKYKTVQAGHLVAKITVEDKEFKTVVVGQDW